MADKIQGFVDSYVESYQATLSQAFNQTVQLTKVKRNSTVIEKDGISSAEFEWVEMPYAKYHLETGLQDFIKTLGLKGNTYERYYLAAYQRLMEIYHQERLTRARKELVNPQELQAIYIECASDHFNLSKVSPRGFEEGDVNAIQQKFFHQQKGVEYLRKVLTLKNADPERLRLKPLRQYSGEIFALSNLDASSFREPNVKIDLIQEAINILETGILDTPLRTSENSLDLAESYLLLSDYYYHLAIMYRDEFHGDAAQEDEARRCLHKAKQMRDMAKPIPPSPRDEPVVEMSPRSAKNSEQIVKLVRTSDERHALLQAEAPTGKPVKHEKDHIDIVADTFIIQRRRDNNFSLFLSSCNGRLKPLSCLYSLFGMHLEANRAMENNDFYEGIVKFEVFMARKISAMSNKDLRAIYRGFTTENAINLMNGLFIFHAYPQRLGLKYDSNRIESATISNAQKLHELMSITLNVVRMAMLLRGLEAVANKALLGSVQELPENVVVKLSYRNNKAVKKALDSINKGKIALLPKEAEHCGSYRKVVRSFRYIFNSRQLATSFMDIYSKLLEVNPHIKDEDAQRNLAREYVQNALWLTKTDELIWLYHKLASPPVQQFFTHIKAARHNLGARNKFSNAPAHQLEFLDYIFGHYQEMVRAVLLERGFDTKAYVEKGVFNTPFSHNVTKSIKGPVSTERKVSATAEQLQKLPRAGQEHELVSSYPQDPLFMSF